MSERVSFWSMLLDLDPIGSDIPVPTSLPGRAPVSGFVPGGTPCGVIVPVVWASTGAPARPTSMVADRARERIGIFLPAVRLVELGNGRGDAAIVAERH